MDLWPNFRSPLIWDVFAVSTYATVSILFWYVGLIPDLATMRDRAQNLSVKRIYGFLSLGWRGSAMHWQRYEIASLLLAGLATPLVLSVHTVVSFDFAVSVVPGWHATIFPPYFVAGRDLLGLRDGAHAGDPDPCLLRPGRLHHDAAHPEHGEDHAGDRAHRALRLLGRGLHGLVRGQRVGRLHDRQPRHRALLVRVRGPHLLQRRHTADAVVQEGADQHPAAVRDLAHRERRHVARTVRDRRHQPAVATTCRRRGASTPARCGTG